MNLMIELGHRKLRCTEASALFGLCTMPDRTAKDFRGRLIFA
jgi:hypothetical protein